MEKTMTVKLEKENCKFYPVKATWKQNGEYYVGLYESAAEARSRFSQQYYPIKIRFIENL